MSYVHSCAECGESADMVLLPNEPTLAAEGGLLRVAVCWDHVRDGVVRLVNISPTTAFRFRLVTPAGGESDG